jgi:hypothetical protein
MKDGDKENVHSAIRNQFRIFSSRLCYSLYDIKEKRQLELRAPLELIAN